ncbi:MAG: DUF2207 domain-containing protein [Ruminococcus sp.]|nr:DUF2207 domain-containing protein [Ruminococcus sp.]
MNNSRRKQFGRSAFLMIFIMIFSMLSLPLYACASEKEYRVDSAEFKIIVEDNGDISVGEIWKLTFEKGSFSRFSKDIYNPPNQLEYIKEVGIGKGRINGSDVEYTKTEERPEDPEPHYCVVPNSDRFTVSWIRKSENESVEYEIYYKLPKAVRLDENDRAAFCLRPIGENFPKEVGSVKATVVIPTKDDTLNYTVSSGSGTVSANMITFTDSNHSGMYKLRFDMSSANFHDLTRVADVVIPESALKSNNSEAAAAIALIGGFFVLPIGVVAGVPIARKHHYKKLSKENPDFMDEAADRLEASGIPYAWYAIPPFRNIYSTDNYMKLFYIELFDLNKKGYINITPEGLLINRAFPSGEWDEVQSSMDRAFLDMLCKLFPVVSGESGSVIDFAGMKENAASSSFASGLLNELYKWLLKYSKVVKNSPRFTEIKTEGQLESIKKDLKLWQSLHKYTGQNLTAQDCFRLVERMGKVTSYTILSFLNSVNIGQYTESTTYNDDSYYFLYYVNHSFSAGSSGSSSGGSSCASCSSCSSCSGCGGGGAS